MIFTRQCPKCNSVMEYSGQFANIKYNDGIRHNRTCMACNSGKFKRGYTPWIKGKSHTNEMKEKMKVWNSHIFTDEQKEKVSVAVKNNWKNPAKRKNMINASRWKNKVVDKGFPELLNKWTLLGFKFEPNHQVHTDTDLFYIDGYDKEHNVVLEYDTAYHFRSNRQKQKDLIRQNKIIDILKPKKFWRYNAITNQFRNVLEREG
jgi:uncharacterized Fe-S cluster protein YjdI